MMAKRTGKTAKRLHLIPDRDFKKMWDEAGRHATAEEYVKTYVRPASEKRVDFHKKYGLGPVQAKEMLDEIYAKRNMGFREILEEAGKRKADVSNAFCIPIRTVEAWYDGTNPCAPYIRLMLIRHYYLMDLGKWTDVESQRERKEAKPSVYEKKTETKSENGLLTGDATKESSAKPENKANSKTGTKRESALLKEESIDEMMARFDERIAKAGTKERVVVKSREDYYRLLGAEISSAALPSPRQRK